MKNSMIIGLTGQTGAGKSLVAKIFEDAYRYNVIDCDDIVANLYKKNNFLINAIAVEFSERILDKNSQIDKKVLAGIVFEDKEKLKALTNIVFPYVISEINYIIAKFKADNTRPIVIDAPTLFESGLNSLCAMIVSVVSTFEVRQKRIMDRDNITEDDATKRIEAQLSEVFFREHSHFVIDNNEGIVPLKEKINMIAQTIDSLN